MIFPMFAFVAVFVSAIFYLFGFSAPDGSIWGVLFTAGDLKTVLTNVLTSLWNSVDIFGDLFGALTTIVAGGAIAAGIYFNRDEPLYGGLGILLFKMLGLYSIITYSQVPAGLEGIVLVFMGLFNTLFIISFINWIRGKGE
jgi:hypothetical protein